MTLRTMVNRRDIRVAVSNSFIVTTGRGELTAEAIGELEQVESQVAQTHGRFTTLVVFSSFMVGPPSAAAREAASRLAKKLEKNTCAVAFVVSQRGLGAVVVRTFLSAYFMVTHTEFPQQVFKSVGEAAAWLALQPGVDPVVAEPTLEAEIAAFLDEK